MTNEQEVLAEITEILTAPVRAQIQTADIRVGHLSSTGLGEKVADLAKLFRARDTQVREAIEGMKVEISETIAADTEAEAHYRGYNKALVHLLARLFPETK